VAVGRHSGHRPYRREGGDMTDDETCNRSRDKLKILPKQPLWLRRVVLAVT
jgi:hypothetical protein